MPAIIFPDTPFDLPPHVVEASGTGALSKRLREYATLIEQSCGPSALTRDLREAAEEIEWLKAKEH
jgi:hypothetical protein